MLRKSFLLKIKKIQPNKTLMTSKYNFKVYFVVFWSNFIK